MSFSQRKFSSVVNLPVDWWLVTLVMVSYMELSFGLCWCVIWQLSKSCSQVSHDECKSMLLSPCLSPILSIWPLWSWAHWTLTWIAGKRGWLYMEESFCVNEFWTPPQLNEPFDQHLQGIQGSLYSFPFHRDYSHSLSSDVFSHQFSNPAFY